MHCPCSTCAGERPLPGLAADVGGEIWVLLESELLKAQGHNLELACPGPGLLPITEDIRLLDVLTGGERLGFEHSGQFYLTAEVYGFSTWKVSLRRLLSSCDAAESTLSIPAQHCINAPFQMDGMAFSSRSVSIRSGGSSMTQTRCSPVWSRRNSLP